MSNKPKSYFETDCGAIIAFDSVAVIHHLMPTQYSNISGKVSERGELVTRVHLKGCDMFVDFVEQDRFGIVEAFKHWEETKLAGE